MELFLAIAAADLKQAGIYVLCLVLSIGVHEYFHALAAHKLGDPTPEVEGRLTLNPLVHADPIGTLLLPLVLGLSGSGVLFGWGKPVPTQPRHYTRRVTMRGGLAIVAVAGPMGNLVLAIAVLIVAFFVDLAGAMHGQLAELFLTMLTLNVVLMAFNLIPLHPLDGGKILAALLPTRLQHVDDFLLRYGSFILIGLMIAGGRILGLLFDPFLRGALGVWRVVIGA